MKRTRHLTICVCGGGSQAHALAAVFGANPAVRVRLLTRRPAAWQRVITAEYLDEALIEGTLAQVSNNPAEVVSGAEVVFLAVPSVARAQVLQRLRPHLRERVWLGCVPGFGGFAWQARDIVGPHPRLFGFQRVPFVCHKVEYGRRVRITGVRPRHCLGTHPAGGAREIAELLQRFGNLYTVPMGHYLNVCFSRSNSLFHPARLHALFGRWPARPLPANLVSREFYRHWDHEATEAFGRFDAEVRAASDRIPLDLAYAVPLLQHYEVAALRDLTAQIRSLRSLWDRRVPVRRMRAGLAPDVESYYFTEDIPYGLVIVRSILGLVGTPSPFMDSVLRWAQGVMARDYLRDGNLSGADMASLPTPQNHGITTLDALVEFCRA